MCHLMPPRVTQHSGASDSPLHVDTPVTDVGPAGRHVDLAQACSLATSDTSSEDASCPLGPL